MDNCFVSLTRRQLLAAAGLVATSTRLRYGSALAGGSSVAGVAGHDQLASELVIDLAGEPGNLDPATTYDVNGWSVIHSIYDSVVQYNPAGELEMLLAESLTQVDPLTWEVKLRSGILFHNGEPLTSESISFSIAHIVDEATGSQIAGNFRVIEEVVLVDDLTAQLKISAPAPWLPAQMAAWLVLLPPVYTASNDFLVQPVGTGPYRFVDWKPGEAIHLERNQDGWSGSPKGDAVAENVTFRFVADGSTRVSDLLSGGVDIVRNLAPNDLAVIEESGARTKAVDVSGSAWIRIPTDVAPFDDVRVRQALNYAVDVDAVIRSLLGGFGQGLPNFFVPGGLGFDPALAPYPYDPERAKAFLADAGYPDGFETALDYAVTENADIVQAIAGQLTAIGIKTRITGRELAVFNSGDWWLGKDPEAAPLRFATWRPLFDPHTLLSLIVSRTGFLSRHDNPAVQDPLDRFAVETDPVQRAAIGLELGVALFDEPAAIYLYSLSSLFGAAGDAPDWSTRADDYLLPTWRAGEQ